VRLSLDGCVPLVLGLVMLEGQGEVLCLESCLSWIKESSLLWGLRQESSFMFIVFISQLLPEYFSP
jgi:hypothetical protein